MTSAFRSFSRLNDAKLYADGLQAGINFESTCGSDPSAVELTTDLETGRYSVFVVRGYYSDGGHIVWPAHATQSAQDAPATQSAPSLLSRLRKYMPLAMLIGGTISYVLLLNLYLESQGL